MTEDHLLAIETKEVEEGYKLTIVCDGDVQLLAKGTVEPGSYGTYEEKVGMTIRVTGKGRLHVALTDADEMKAVAKGETLRLVAGTKYDLNVLKPTAFVATYDLPPTSA